MKLKELASLLDGEIIGNPDIEISGVSGIPEAQDGDITFISSKKYLKDIPDCKASCVIVQESIGDTAITQLKVRNPALAFAKTLEYFYVKQPQFIGISDAANVSSTSHIHETASVFPFSFIADNASIGEGTVIYPFVFIGENTVVGANCTLYPNVTVREGVTIGDRVIIHSGTIIGSDGFGYIFNEGMHYKIPQVGGIIIEEDVEIGANVTIDRATTGKTIIGAGTKIDNLVQIAHNVKIGKHSILVAQVGIAGSTEIGDYVILGGQVGVADHSQIESQTMIGAQSGVKGTLKKGVYSGSPVMPHREWLKARAIVAKLPELHKKIRELEQKVRDLERRNPS